MYSKLLKYSKYFLLLILLSCTFQVTASESIGTIDDVYYTAQICEDVSCSVSSTSPVNFGNFTTSSSSNVSITDTELTGYIWGESFGWVVLNCFNTTSGCSATNGNFKAANDGEGNLSGYAWGENAGWINFGPFSNSSTNSVAINSLGEFNGYIWAQNYGWIKFDCSLTNYCVKTDWRPVSSRPVVNSISENTSGSYLPFLYQEPVSFPEIISKIIYENQTPILTSVSEIITDLQTLPSSKNKEEDVFNKVKSLKYGFSKEKNIVKSNVSFIEKGVECINGERFCFLDKIDNKKLIEGNLVFSITVLIISLVFLIFRYKNYQRNHLYK